MTLKIERFQPEGMNVRMSNGQPSYSHVVTVSGAGKIVYIAGQLARDIDGNCVGRRRAPEWDTGSKAEGGQIMRCLFRSLFTFVCLPVAVSAVTLTMGPGQTARAADPSTFPAPTGDRAVLPPDAKLEQLFDGGCVLTEGVAVAPDGMVYFSDITFTHVSQGR